MNDENIVQSEEQQTDQAKEELRKSSGKQTKDEVKELKAKIEDLENQLKRAVADYRNFEKRIEEEKKETIKYANRELLLRLIPAFDTLFLAEKYVSDEGIKLTIRHLKEVLSDAGVEIVKTEGVEFDASCMEAVTTGQGEEGIGVPVPNDPSQVMYVWFDALNIYMTGIGFGWDDEKWGKWWPADLHVIGKDINRFHTVYWPAMLLSAGIRLPKHILIHSFIQSAGQKMSKSLGNVIDPFEMIEKYGLEPFRYYLLSQIPIDSDGDFTEERFREVYTANLSNGLGNLVARVAKLAENHNIELNEQPAGLETNVTELLEEFNFNEALQFIWGIISIVDHEINKTKPWELTGDEAKKTISELAHTIVVIAYNLKPFLPETSDKILNQFSGKIRSKEPLFPRLK